MFPLPAKMIHLIETPHRTFAKIIPQMPVEVRSVSLHYLGVERVYNKEKILFLMESFVQIYSEIQIIDKS